MPDTLTRTGVEFLLVYGARLFPARGTEPGMRCTVDSRGAVLIEAVNYPTPAGRATALAEARQTCVDAGLLVVPVNGRALIAKRR